MGYTKNIEGKLQNDVIALAPFAKKARKLFSRSEYDELICFLAKHPEKGDVISGTGGARKLRWSAKGKGKRGGARVIYYYYVRKTRIYLMTAYAKNEKHDLLKKEKDALKYFIETINCERRND